MHRGYRIYHPENIIRLFTQRHSKLTGAKLAAEHDSAIRRQIPRFLDGAIDAARLTTSWFPRIPADVFISYAHDDLGTAISLAGILKGQFGLTPFVDATVWKHANDLLAELDTKYCRNKDGTYDYHRRNRSTSHVHMMLVVALAEMIDSCECVFFLDTPASLSAEEGVSREVSSGSPWIFAELAMTRLVRPRDPHEHRLDESIRKVASEEPELRINHPAEIDHLLELTPRHFRMWKMLREVSSDTPSLDLLYAIVPSPDQQ